MSNRLSTGARSATTSAPSVTPNTGTSHKNRCAFRFAAGRSPSPMALPTRMLHAEQMPTKNTNTMFSIVRTTVSAA